METDQELIHVAHQIEKQQRVIAIVVSIMATIAISLAGWAMMRVIDHEVRITKVESTRFTMQDGAKMLDRITEMEHTIQQQLYGIRERLVQLPTRDEIPPSWFEEKVRALESKIDKYHPIT